jgi:hypothetical protein
LFCLVKTDYKKVVIPYLVECYPKATETRAKIQLLIVIGFLESEGRKLVPILDRDLTVLKKAGSEEICVIINYTLLRIDPGHVGAAKYLKDNPSVDNMLETEFRLISLDIYYRLESCPRRLRADIFRLAECNDLQISEAARRIVYFDLFK